MRSILVCSFLVGCSDEWFLNSDKADDADAEDTGDTDTTEGDADGDSDSDTDGDTDSDADGDSDGDTDSDSDTDTEGELDCEEDYATPAPGEVASCVTEEVFCGDVIYGTLEGGSYDYDYDYWLEHFALGSMLGEYAAFDGPERVYLFRGLEPDQVVQITFESCFNSWADWILFGDTGRDYCDLEGTYTVGIFEGGSGNTWITERINASAGIYDFEFILEGLYGDLGNYVMTVECF